MFGDFGAIDASATAFDDEMRIKVATMLADRAEYMLKAGELSKRKSELLANPPQDIEKFKLAEKELAEYSSTIVAPLRTKLIGQVVPLMQEAVDLDGIKRMWPMLLSAVLLNVKVPLLLNILGYDQDMIEKLVEKGVDFLKYENE